MADVNGSRLLAAPNSGGAGGSGGGGNGPDRWINDRGEVFFRIRQGEERLEKLDDEHTKTKAELVALQTLIVDKLAKIEGKLGLQAFKAGIWATLANAVAMLAGLLMLYWKLTK